MEIVSNWGRRLAFLSVPCRPHPSHGQERGCTQQPGWSHGGQTLCSEAGQVDASFPVLPS